MQIPLSCAGPGRLCCSRKGPLLPYLRTSPRLRNPQHADYKNAAFLSRFLSPAGRLLPRRQTKLPLHVHRWVADYAVGQLSKKGTWTPTPRGCKGCTLRYPPHAL